MSTFAPIMALAALLLIAVDRAAAFVPVNSVSTTVAGRGGQPTRRFYKAGDPYDVTREVPRERVSEIEEEAARDMLERLRSWEVPVPPEVAEGGRLRVTGVAPRVRRPRPETPAVVLLHGFDSSCLEYRRLHPMLEEDVDVFALDVLGWGFSQLSGVKSFSAEAKRAYLHGFWTDVLARRPMVLVGASLGGAVAIDFAHHYPRAVERMVLINPQAFIDGLGGMAALPRPLAKLGIGVLKSVPLRAYAGRLSYHDPDTFSTEDAMRIGRLHCLREGWDEASVDYMLSGGYNTSAKVSAVQAPSLVLWGRQDRILELEQAARFERDMPALARLSFIENCGHVAHLERPRAAANAILDFVLAPTAVGGPSKPGAASSSPFVVEGGSGGVARLSADCMECLDERVVACPNCDGQGYYESYGRRVDCKACRGTGLVICRSCFKGDPEDVAGIRETVRAAAERLGRPAPKAF